MGLATIPPSWTVGRKMPETLLLGSHLDSVPEGGRFDGPLGVLAALEVLRVVKENKVLLPFHLEAIDFTDEEGTLVGELGSAALAGTLDPGALRSPCGGRPALEEGLQRAGLSEEGILSASATRRAWRVTWNCTSSRGLRLFQAQAQVGIVTSIVGIGSYRVAFAGQAGHAGTTPMEDRRDAGLAAGVFLLAVRDIVMIEFPGCVANVGWMRFSPGAFNIIPARAELGLEFRAPDERILDALEEALLARAQAEAGRFRLELETERLDRVLPAQMQPGFPGRHPGGGRLAGPVRHPPGLLRRARRPGAGSGLPGGHAFRPLGRRDQPLAGRADLVGRLRQRGKHAVTNRVKVKRVIAKITL